MASLEDKMKSAPDAKAVTLDQRRIKQLEGVIEQLERQLHDTREAKFVLPTGKPRGGSGRKSHCCVIIPDSHGSLIDSGACKAFLADLEQIQPTEIVMLGDHLECGGFLAQHHTLGYVAQAEYTFAEDVQAANQFLDAIQQRVPHATIHYLAGNHERRIETWIITETLRNRADAAYLHSLFSADIVLHLKKRNIHYYPQGKANNGRDIPSILNLGKRNFMHGEFTGKNAAKQHVDEYVCNMTYGHTHRADSYTRRTVDETYSAFCPGCLSIRQQYWNHAKITHHTHGYGIQSVGRDGKFLQFNVPIIDGASYLKPLASQLGKGI
jgi:UDP-2,3-diacylglucosamine pyrophosphatase LpxH